MICKTFMPCLFFRKTKNFSPVVGALSQMLVRKSRLVLLNLVTPAQNKYLSSTQGIAELTRAVMGGEGFSNADHLWTLSGEQHDGKEARDVAYKYRLKGLISGIKVTEKRLLLCSKITC